MNAMSFEEFLEFYNARGHLPGDVSPRKNRLNDRQLEARYQKYLRKLEKQEEKMQKKKEEVQSQAQKRKPVECKLIKRLREEGHTELLADLAEAAGPMMEKVDQAHILSRGAYPEMREDEENIIGLNRYSHTLLDEFRDPIYGVEIGKEHHRKIWAFIVGEAKLRTLREKVEQKR